MKFLIITSLVLVSATAAFSQQRFPKHELSINGFRSPSIGLEYHNRQVSFHAGYYLTAFKAGETTNFVKTGITYWFAPVDKKEIPSSFYAGLSYMRGLNLEYKDKNAFSAEAGFRWMFWKGFNLRVGAIAVAAGGQDLEINPAGGISYSFKL